MTGEPEAAVWSAKEGTAALPRRNVLTPQGRRAILMAVDLLIVLGSVAGGLAVWAYRGEIDFGPAFLRSNWEWFPLLAIAWLAAATINDLYRPNRVSHFRQVTVMVVRAQVILVIVYLIIYFLSTPRSLPRGLVIYYAAIATPLLFLWRWIFSAVFAQRRFRLRTLVVGAGWAGRTIVEVMASHLGNEYELVGFVDDDKEKQNHSLGGIRVIGDGGSLPELIRLNGIDMLVVAITHGMSAKLFQNVLACQQAGIGVLGMAALYERTLERTPVHHLDEQWFLDFDPPDVLTQAVKRAIDVGFAAVALLAFGMLLPFLALAIYLNSPGPIFYKQERVGKNGRLFRVYKLRSMVVDAEKAGAQWAQKDDPRVTKVGKVLRKTRLDEIPQVWNLLKGDMSLVGPRPERPEFVEKLQKEIPYYRSRLSVKPGLTGWAQVRYRYGNTVEDARIKLEYDLYYIKHQSLALDLSIIMRTVGVVLSMGGT